MNSRDWKPLHRELLSALPGFVSHKRLLLMAPMNGMLRAIHFDPSGYNKDDFYVATIAMPLCVPNEYLSLLFGHRLRHPGAPRGWNRTLPNLMECLTEVITKEGVPFLERIRSVDDFVTMAQGFWGNPHAPKEAAFVLARAGKDERAIAMIEDLLPTLDLDVAWEKTIFDQSSMIRDLLMTQPEEARRTLATWENYTIGRLKLEAFR